MTKKECTFERKVKPHNLWKSEVCIMCWVNESLYLDWDTGSGTSGIEHLKLSYCSHR